MLIIETAVAIAFLVIVITSLELINLIEYRRQELHDSLSELMIPYEELQFREEINSLSLEEIDELFTYQDDVWSAIEDEDAHSMIDDDYGIEFKADDSVSINYEMFEDTIPF